MSLIKTLFGQKGVKNFKKSARMGWRYVTYAQNSEILTIQIEPMAKGPCIVYVPNESKWNDLAPLWAKEKRGEILEYLASIKWNRDIKFIDSDVGFITEEAIPGSLESTPSGREIESKRFFNPGSPVSSEQAKELWCLISRKFSLSYKGKVNVFVSKYISGSVFEEIELPALKENPNVELIFH